MKTASRLVCVLAFLASVVIGAEPPAPAGTTSPSASNIEPAQLIVEDGQLKSYPFRVFITHHVTKAMKPTLDFSGMHLITKAGTLESKPHLPLHVLTRQTRMITIEGGSVAAEGTLLIFDLSGHKIEAFKAAARLVPVVSWDEPPATAGAQSERRNITTEDEIYLGNMPGAILWTLNGIGLVLLIIVWWSVQKSREITKFRPRPALFLITGADGALSLWRAQLMLWTVAVGSVVFLFGLLRLRVPEIPETLVALMGMSVLTGTVSALKTQPKAPPITAGGIPGATGAGSGVTSAAPWTTPAFVSTSEMPGASPTPTTAGAMTPPVPVNVRQPAWSDLISIWNRGTEQVELSVPKAQMFFWTMVILVLFVVKSILLGALWPVPWEMVALTGFSQAGYVGDKFVQANTKT